MLFKDRSGAGNQLAKLLTKDNFIQSNLKNITVVSLLRGGVVVGDIIAQKLNINHLPLVVAKIPSPYNSELAIGGLCFQTIYLDQKIINSLSLDQQTINKQIAIAKSKFNSYLKRFNLQKINYQKRLKNTIIILTDDGIATGATIYAALLYLHNLKVETIILAVPVAPTEFDTSGFDKIYILHKDPLFSAVSQFYQSFSQVEDDKVLQIISSLSQQHF